MARVYGWTFETIDALGMTGRGRVRDMWIVRALVDEADEHLETWSAAQAGSMRTVERLRGTSDGA